MSQNVVSTNTVDAGDYLLVRTTYSDGSVSEQTQWKAGTAPANAETLRQQALTALTTNRTYVARTSPTAAQTTAQVQALSQQNNGLIRLLLGLLDGTN